MDENTPIDNNRGFNTSFNSNKRKKRSTTERSSDQQIELTTNTITKTTTYFQRAQPAKQLEHITRLRQKSCEGDEYLVATLWWVKFEKFCLGLCQQEPGPVDNTVLLQEDGQDIRPDIELEKDYFLVSDKAWIQLVQWYGVTTPHSALVKKRTKRAKIQLNTRPKQTNKLSAVEVLHRLQRREVPLMNTTRELGAPLMTETNQVLHFVVHQAGKSSQISNKFDIQPDATVLEFRNTLLTALKLSLEAEIELWLLNNNIFTASSRAPFHITPSLLENSNYTLHIDTSNIDFDTTIGNCLQSLTTSTFNYRKNHNYYYLVVDYVGKGNTTRVFSSYPPTTSTSRTISSVGTPGLCGLQNLGNTCYMNSALQCLSNTPQLTKWFLNQDYKKDINISNPLGLNGELAESFASVIKSIWSHHSSFRSSISPKDFKNTFERFNPHFTGYQQQDSQELLSFLLDGLHEDLNRIINKPYIEIPDFDDELADKEVATCFWNYHKARNDSVIVDLFQGQFKSRLTCDECKKVSVTFDPFMYLSLPLPSAEAHCNIDVIYVPYSPLQKQRKMTVSLNKEAKIGHLKQEVENNIALSLSSEPNDGNLLVVEMYQGKIFRLFTDVDPVDSIHASDIIYVYELPCPTTSKNDDDWIIFPVYCATTIDPTQQLISSPQFGFPLVLAVEANKLRSMNDLYEKIVDHIQRYCSVSLFELGTSGAEKEDDDKEDTKLDEPDLDVIANSLLSQETAVGKDTEETRERKVEIEKEENLTSSQQSTLTSKAVSPSGMATTAKLFNIKIFDRQKGAATISKSKLAFPTGSQIHWNNDQKHTSIVLKQGQGVVIEWSVSKAQQVFGKRSSSSLDNIYEHDHHSDINTDTWREYDEIITSSATTKKPAMTTRLSLTTSSTTSTLEDCLNEFTGDERLSNDDLWYCPRCKRHQRASKKFDIWRLPEILVVHLKRFSQVRSWGNKIDTFIDFPITGLDMTDRVLSSKEVGDGDNERLMYDLYAVDNHYGGMGGGHYTSYAQNLDNQCWYEFDDSHVTKKAEQDIKSKAAYLLFYKRRR